MAKKPLPAKRAPAGGPPKGGPSAPKPQQSEAVGKFDKFSAFGLAIPAGVLAIIALVLAIGYTSKEFDVGLFGFPKKSIADWNGGSASIQTLGAVQITGFETHNYIGRLSEGEVDVAVLNVGTAHGVNLGDVFTLATPTDASVRLEFVVFDAGDNISRAYILLGQDVADGGKRKYSLSESSMKNLCGGTSAIDIKREWKDQIIRRYTEARTNAQ